MSEVPAALSSGNSNQSSSRSQPRLAQEGVSSPSQSFFELRAAVHEIKQTSDSTPRVPLVTSSDYEERVSTRSIFGAQAFAECQELTRLIHDAAETDNPGEHQLVRLYCETGVQIQPRWRKAATWLLNTVLRRSPPTLDHQEPNYIRRKADSVFESLWYEIKSQRLQPDVDHPQSEVIRHNIHEKFEMFLTDYVNATNRTNLRRDLVYINEHKKYRSHATVTDIATRYSLPRQQAAKIVKSEVKLPVHSPLRLVAETAEIGRLVQLDQKKRALGALALYAAGSSIAIGLSPLLAANILTSGASIQSVMAATGAVVGGVISRAMMWSRTEQLTGEVCETLNNKITGTLFDGQAEKLAAFDPSRLYNALNEGKQAVEKTLHTLVHTVLGNTIIAVTSLASLASKSPTAAAVAVCGIAPTYVLLKRIGARYYAQREAAIRARNDATKFLQDGTQGVNFLRTVACRKGAKDEMQGSLNRSERIERTARSRYFRNFFLARIPLLAATQLPAATVGTMGAGAEVIAAAVVAGPQITFSFDELLNYFAQAGDSGQRIEELRKVIDAVSDEKNHVVPERHDVILHNTRVILPKEVTDLKGPKRRLLDLQGHKISMPEGSLIAFCGKSGIGKTTAAGTLAGFVPYQGEVSIGGIPAREVKTNEVIAYAPQAAHFNTKQTVLENLLPGVSGEERIKKRGDITDMLCELGMDKFTDMLDNPMPEKPSGGESKRLNLVRALADSSAKIVILDEPTSELDELTAGKVHAMLEIYRQRNPMTTVIVITHDTTLRDMSDQIIDFSELVQE